MSHLGGGEAADVVLQLLPTGQRFDLRTHAAGLVHEGVKLLVPPAGRAGRRSSTTCAPIRARRAPIRRP